MTERVREDKNTLSIPPRVRPDTFGFILALEDPAIGWPKDQQTGEPLVDEFTRQKLVRYLTTDIPLSDLVEPDIRGWRNASNVGFKLTMALLTAFQAAPQELKAKFPQATGENSRFYLKINS